jgi:arylsulfatase A-like enzyme
LSHYTVHPPIQACRRHLPKFQKKFAELQENITHAPEGEATTRVRQDNSAYSSMVYALDENMGRLLAKLDELRLKEKTVVIFTSDNGGLSTLRRGPGPTSVRPLRAGKGWCYEGGIRVPLIIRAPGMTQAGSRSTARPFTGITRIITAVAGRPAQPCGLAIGSSSSFSSRARRNCSA